MTCAFALLFETISLNSSLPHMKFYISLLIGPESSSFCPKLVSGQNYVEVDYASLGNPDFESWEPY